MDNFVHFPFVLSFSKMAKVTAYFYPVWNTCGKPKFMHVHPFCKIICSWINIVISRITGD